jgi:hypothetical protein
MKRFISIFSALALLILLFSGCKTAVRTMESAAPHSGAFAVQPRIENRIISSDDGAKLITVSLSLPSLPGEVTGDAAQAMAAVRSAFTPAGVLEALQGNERLLDRDYDAAVMAVEYDDYPQGVQLALQDCYADEQEHLSTVEEFLDRFAAPAS